MKKIVSALSPVFFAAACYSSSHGTGDTQSDSATDPTADTRPDTADVPVEPDVPPPQYSVTFIIENDSPLSCSSCVYYLDYQVYMTLTYGLGITWNGLGIDWHDPFCTMACEDVTDPMYCCVDCAAPMPAVKQLTPGESVSVIWGGSIYAIDSELCDCGCFRQSLAPAGSGTARVCAYRSYACYLDDACAMDEEGVIPMAEVEGEPICGEASFSFPADDGSRVFVRIQ